MQSSAAPIVRQGHNMLLVVLCVRSDVSTLKTLAQKGLSAVFSSLLLPLHIISCVLGPN